MLYKVVKGALLFVLFPFVRVDIQNEENFPKETNFIIVANHKSNFDPVLLAINFKMKVHFMAKEELFKIFLVGRVLKKIGMIPVRRGESDRKAIKEALGLLKKGGVLALFPEGTRSKTDDMLKFHTGAAFFSRQSKLKIVPIGIKGTKDIKFGLSNKVIFNIGQPIDINEQYEGKITSANLEEFSSLLREKVKGLLGE